MRKKAHKGMLKSEAPRFHKTVLTSAIGNALEWYDFALFGYFSTLLAQLFFPLKDPVAGLLATYGAFAAGFLMRPVGGVLFGWMGDKWGRKKALVWSIHLMSWPTFLVGCLPTYAVAGWWAPALLTLIRLLQGLSMGGGFTGSIIFIVEHAPSKRRGFWGSFAPLSALMGVLLGSGLATGLNHFLSDTAVASWGWRLAFWLSILGGFVGRHIKKYASEPAAPKSASLAQKAQNLQHTTLKHIFRTLWKHHRPALCSVFLADFLVAVGFYMIVTFLVGYFERVMHLPRDAALQINTYSMLLFAAVIPASGLALDRWGRKPVMYAAACGFLVLAWPLFTCLQPGNFAWACATHMTLALMMGMYFAAIPAVLVESFPSSVRSSGIALAHNLSMALFGGSTPFVVMLLIKATHSYKAPAFCLILASLGALAGIRMLKDGTHKPLP